jgi:hypothetical protein
VTGAIDLTSLTDNDAVFALLIITITLVAAAAAWLLTRSMVRAATLPDPQPLVVAIALLTLVALLGALVTGNESAYTLAATGLGAIAGALTATYKDGGGDRDADAGLGILDAPEPAQGAVGGYPDDEPQDDTVEPR